ncbi:retrovirus-related pol polyprotein from transposon TNT 1-94 [Tanacetum coccineum]
MLSSIGVKPSTSASGSQPSGNTKKDKIQQTPSSTQKNKIEAYPRKVKSSLPTGQTFTIVGNACPLTRITTTTEVPCRIPSALDNETPKPVVTLVYLRKPRKYKTNGPVIKSKVVQIVLRYLDSGCSKHMTGDYSQLTNFVNKFLGKIKFGNDHVVKILGYSDYQIGNVMILRVYYVEGLGHNLFSVGDMMASSPICLWSKASKTKSWLRHRRLSHLNFGAIKHLARHGLVRGLPKLKFEKDHLCSACAMGKSKKKPHKPISEDTNQEKLYLLHMDLYGPMRVASVKGKKYILVIVEDYSGFTWVKFLSRGDDDENDDDNDCRGGGEVMKRVRESGYGDRIDRKMGLVFGVGRKIPPEKFSGGGATAAAVAGRQPEFMGEREEEDEVEVVYVTPSALDNETPKPVVTLVYLRKPRKSKTNGPISKSKVVQIVLCYLDSGCSKHMTGDRSQLTNFIGNVMISRVYYVEGLGHNLFSVGQFCDSNLEVAFCQHTCFIRNLEGVDLLTGSRGNNLYTLSLGDMMVSSPICLLSKASKTKSWLRHRRLSHLNFGAINHLARHGLVRGLPKLKFEKNYLCSACAIARRNPTNLNLRVASVKGKKYILVIVEDYLRFTWVKFLRSKYEAPDFIIKFLKMIQINISHETSISRSPHQNGVVERRNRTLIEAARTMLIYTKAPLFLWAEAVATASPEVIAPIVEVVAPEPANSNGSPSSTTVDQDTPSASNSQSTTETQSLVISNDVKEDDHDLDVAHMNNDPFFGIPILEHDYEASSSSDVNPTIELIPRPDKVMVITLKWIYKVKLDELGGILKNKAGLVARGYCQDERIDFKESIRNFELLLLVLLYYC